MKAVVLLFDKRRGCNKTSMSSGCGEICSVNIKQQPSPPLSPPLLRGISLKGARCNSGLRRIPSFSHRRSRPRKPQGSLLRRPFKTERRWRWRSQGSERRGEVRKEKKVPLLNCRGQKRTPPPCERVETTQKKAPPERRRQKKKSYWSIRSLALSNFGGRGGYIGKERTFGFRSDSLFFVRGRERDRPQV